MLTQSPRVVRPTPESPSLEGYLQRVTLLVEQDLRQVVQSRARQGPARLWDAISYALLGGGKRLRPALVCATAEAFGGETVPGSVALRFGAALEMIHAYSLVHDDLPCMDDDDLRRGRPTVHRAFDEATALLVGDALQSLALEHILDGGDDHRFSTLARLLAGGATRMVEGQFLDLEAEERLPGLEGVLDLQRRKTGALLAAALIGGAIAATGSDQALGPVGLKLGIAFQIADDLLDLTATTAELGKRVGKDAGAGKATLPALLGPVEARRRAEHYRDEALSAFDGLGDKAEPLRALARYVVARRR
ncbi:MAG TPA: polyprenyl synthetase family protein [Anaeromyxobacteraceae bacterium]|nr:polyprenyl synthetase family protein [Anaeromyxobacteraceae bacterium]